jgi:hypothetical protein
MNHSLALLIVLITGLLALSIKSCHAQQLGKSRQQTEKTLGKPSYLQVKNGAVQHVYKQDGRKVVVNYNTGDKVTEFSKTPTTGKTVSYKERQAILRDQPYAVYTQRGTGYKDPVRPSSATYRPRSGTFTVKDKK